MLKLSMSSEVFSRKEGDLITGNTDPIFCYALHGV